jgi:CRISPR-associated protein Cas2
MSRNKQQPYLIAYNTSDSRRLQRVHRLLKRRAITMQKSVFITVLNEADREALTAAIEALIDPKADDVRLYPLPQRPEWYAWSDALWPDGMTITGTPLPKHYH